MASKGSVTKGLLIIMILALIPLSAYGTNHAGPKTPSCGNYKVSTNEIIVGVKFPKGTYQINSFGISCTKVMGSKGLFAKFLKLKDKDPLPKPWRYLADAVGAPKFSSGPGVGFRVQLITPTATPTPTVKPTYMGPLDIFGTPTSEEALIVDKLVDIAWDKGKPATQFVVSTVNDRVKGTTWSNDNAAMLPAITRILDGVGAPLTRKVDWYVWWDLQSLTPLLPPNCWAKDTRFFDAKAVGAGYCRPSTIFIFFEAYQQWYPKEGFLEKYPNEWDKYGIAAVTAGEVVHFSQQTYGEKFGHEAFNFYPAWLREGPSILYSAMAYAKYMNMPYSTVRNLALQHFKNYKCGEVLLTDLLMFNQSDRFCEYSGGLLASEYMIAKSGDVLAPFRYLESKMKGDGEQCQSPHRICRPSYESVIREIYANDVDAWHRDLQDYIIRWAR
jgi:hypothetical protein